MDIWTILRTVLQENPGIKAKELLAKLRERTDLSRSTIYYHLGSYELRGKIWREKGRYWLPEQKPPNSKVSLPDTALWKKQASEGLNDLWRVVANKEDLERVPEATLFFIKATLPGPLKEKLKPDIAELEKQVAWAYSAKWPSDGVYTLRMERRIRRKRLRAIAIKTVPEILDKVSTLSYQDQ